MKKVLIVLLLLLLIGCNKKEEINDNSLFKIGYSSNLINTSDREELKRIFVNNNISNIDLFFNWLDDFNKNEDNGCGIKDFDKTENFKYDDFKSQDRYESNHEGSDGNCRITSFALLEDSLIIEEKQQNYGSYLMFDIDVLENNEDYKIIKEREMDFISLFDEMDASKVNRDEYKNVYTNKWTNYKISNTNKNVSLISIVMNDEYSNLLYVGHSGILIKLDDKYIFVEKIAFENPYQISIIKDINDLKEIFMKRENYFGDASEAGPFVYENNKLLFELK